MDRNAVLVVDDEEGIREMVAASLEESGRKVYSAETPIDALVIVGKQADVGVAVLDIRMPGMNGLELCAAIGDLHPEIKVMFMTGYSDHGKMPNHTVITKPFRITLLLKMIETKFL